MDLSDQTMQLDELESGDALLVPNGPLLGPAYNDDGHVVEDHALGPQFGGAPFLRTKVLFSERLVQSAEQEGNDVLKAFQTRTGLRRGENGKIVQALGTSTMEELVRLHDSSSKPVDTGSRSQGADPILRIESKPTGAPMGSSVQQPSSTLIHQPQPAVQSYETPPVPRLPPFSSLPHASKDASPAPLSQDVYPPAHKAQPSFSGDAPLAAGVVPNFITPKPPAIPWAARPGLRLVPVFKPPLDPHSKPPTTLGGEPNNAKVVESVDVAIHGQGCANAPRTSGGLPFPRPPNGESRDPCTSSSPRPGPPPAVTSTRLPEQQESAQVTAHSRQDSPTLYEPSQFSELTPTGEYKITKAGEGNPLRKGRLSKEALAKECTLFSKIAVELKSLSLELHRPLQNSVQRLVDYLGVTHPIPRAENTYNLYQKYFARHREEEEKRAGLKGCKECYHHFSSLHHEKGEGWPEIVKMLCEKDGLLALESTNVDDQRRYFQSLMKRLESQAMDAASHNFHLVSLVASGDRSDPSLTGAIPPPEVPSFFDDNVLFLTKAEIITVLQHHVEATQLEQLRNNHPKPKLLSPRPNAQDVDDEDESDKEGDEETQLSTPENISPEAMYLAKMKGDKRFSYYQICRLAVVRLVELASGGKWKCRYTKSGGVVAPWKDLPDSCAKYGLVITHWPIDVPLAIDLGSICSQGIRDLPVPKLKALAKALHGPPDERVKVIRLTDPTACKELREGKRPVITTTRPQSDSPYQRARSVYVDANGNVRVEQDGEPRLPPSQVAQPCGVTYEFLPPHQPPPPAVTRRGRTPAGIEPAQEGGGFGDGRLDHYESARGPPIRVQTSKPNDAHVYVNMATRSSEARLHHHPGIGGMQTVLQQQTGISTPGTYPDNRRILPSPATRMLIDQPTHQIFFEPGGHPSPLAPGSSGFHAPAQTQPTTQTDMGAQAGMMQTWRLADPPRPRRRSSSTKVLTTRHEPYGRVGRSDAGPTKFPQNQLSGIPEDASHTPMHH